MSFPWIPVGIGVCCVVAVCKSGRHKDYGVMTDERQRIYQAALNGSLKNPEDLRKLAAAFHAQGLFPQSALLEQRAALKERTPEVKAAHDMAFRRALASSNRSAIMEVAEAFKSIGATGAAAKLMMRAAGLPDPGEIREEVTQQPEEQTADVSSASDESAVDETPPTRIGGTVTHEITPTESVEQRPAIAALPAHAESVQPLVIVTEGTAA